MILKRLTAALTALAVVALAGPASAAPGSAGQRAAASDLERSAAGAVEIRWDAHSGDARYVRSNTGGDLMPQAAAGDKSRAFLRRHGKLFGLTDADRDLVRADAKTDWLGQNTTTWHQSYRGVPVFGARLKTAVDRDGRLRTVNGAVARDIDLNVIPSLAARDAAARAIAHVQAQAAPRQPGTLDTADGTLYVFNSGFIRGRSGFHRLVWEIEVSGVDTREFVYVDAHSGKIADQITGTYDAINRRIYDGGFGGGFLVWTEGNSTPTASSAWDDLIDYSNDTYNLYSSITGGDYRSWDGVDGTMHAVNNDPAITCPNAQFTGSYIRFCDGTTTDDVVAHEWSHGYTQATHGLIYLNQSGALNEAYSDIFGEIVDFLNGDGNDSPGGLRTDNGCSVFGGSSAPILSVSAPAAVAGDYFVGGAAFNPTGGVSITADAQPTSPANGCSAVAGNVAGRIALIDRGSCDFSAKVANAEAAGAVGVIIINNQGDGVIEMGGGGPVITIPSVFVGQSDGTTLKNASGVAATIVLGTSSDSTYRWLVGEDSSAFGGAIRDMYTPSCMGDPGKVSDRRYACDPDGLDNGGVHSNSGIINHGFALLTDGGTYNGQTVAPIGLTKAAHLYWRTMDIYQTPISGYADHAAALAAACSDLIGANLSTLSTEQETTGFSGSVIDANDCAQVDKIVLALELNQQPVQCGFETLLAQDPPAECNAGETAQTVLDADFEAGLGTWSTGSRAIVSPATFDVPAWSTTSELPFGLPGQAAFGADPIIGNCQGDIEAGVNYLQSPSFVVPADGKLSFEHSLSTERDYDGGNLKVSVNGGSYQLVPGAAFIYNAYNGALLASDNPLGGEAAFHGTDGGTFLSAWGQSQIDLTSIASAGDTVTLRFEMGTDGCNGVVGWYVDNVRAFSCEVAANDTDNDGVSDNLDNCTLVPNALQTDSNGDGYGNLCDADLNNDGVTNAIDLGLLKVRFFSTDADADLNSDGVVNVLDLGLMKTLFFQAPGPSGVAP